MAEEKTEVNAVRKLTATLGTNLDGLVPAVKKFIREKDEALGRSS